jgi:hypothetical protein
LETEEACKQVTPSGLGREAKTIDSRKQNTTTGVLFAARWMSSLFVEIQIGRF